MRCVLMMTSWRQAIFRHLLPARRLALGSIAILALIANQATSAPGGGYGHVDQARLDKAASDPANWMTYGGTYAEQRFSQLSQISTETIARLGLAWSFEFDTNRGQEATPVVVDGIIYVSTAWSKVFAIDGRTGKQIWSFDPEVDRPHAMAACCDVVNRGVAVWKGKVYVGTIDGRLIAIDAKSGKKLWDVQTTDKSKPYTITGAPRVFRDKVIIGNGGAELGVRGYVTAYDTATGKQVWRFYTVPGDPAKEPDGAASDSILATALSSWAGHWYDYGGGGTVWDSMVYDPDLNQLYIGVGNGSPWPHLLRSEGKGDNLFLGSVVALDPDTGKYLWHYQETPADSWDYTSTQQITLATLKIDGADRQVILHAPKNGFFYVIDRKSGKLISAKNFVPVTWADGVDIETGRPRVKDGARYEKAPFMILPESTGAHNWQPMSFSPLTGLVYLPAMDQPAVMAPNPDFKFRPGGWNIATRHVGPSGFTIPKSWGALIAWDPLAQKEVWRAPQIGLWSGGTLATAGNLVFAGSVTGEFTAYNARDGKPLWQYVGDTSIQAGPVSYSIDGVQYVAVMAGAGGIHGLFNKIPGKPQRGPVQGRLLVFKLDGKAKHPALADESLPPPNPPAESFTTAQVDAGRDLYFGGCFRCHAGHVLPDLRRSGALADRDTWKAIVVDQALKDNGMAPDWLNAEQAEQIRAYIAEESRKLAEQTGK
jgi:PQQ-dependent dehydrogenase (methanol/ethanol family)